MSLNNQQFLPQPHLNYHVLLLMRELPSRIPISWHNLYFIGIIIKSWCHWPLLQQRFQPQIPISGYNPIPFLEPAYVYFRWFHGTNLFHSFLTLLTLRNQIIGIWLSHVDVRLNMNAPIITIDEYKFLLDIPTPSWAPPMNIRLYIEKTIVDKRVYNTNSATLDSANNHTAIKQHHLWLHTLWLPKMIKTRNREIILLVTVTPLQFHSDSQC